MAEEEEVVTAELVVAALPAVNNNSLLDVNADSDWRLEDAVALGEVKRVGLKHKSRELLKKCCAKRWKVSTSVAESFTLTSELLGTVDAHMSMTERVARAKRREKL